ncbi:MAG: transketolase [Pseudomonadales bacterium]|nr:transketolase [Pseudomonadales bacterium]
MTTQFEQANAIRALSMDAVQKAKSGHPGAPMGMADIATVLWGKSLKHNPANPDWVNRDRFVLSNGHGSMLLYSLLHLTGYDLSLDEIKNFRQFGSKTPGHPEYHDTPGVETTTGPLGQGLANAVGMAIAERMLADQFNRESHKLIDHNTWVFMGDGCLMEGISHEVCSLAGTLGLGKLVGFYDSNGISIDGEIEGWYSEDVKKRFESYGWQVIGEIDGHDHAAIEAAIAEAQAESDKPTLVICKTIIGFGSPNKQGSESCHGAPLGDEEIKATREALGWSHPAFEIPEPIYQAWDATTQGQKAESEWNTSFQAYQTAYPELADELLRRTTGMLPTDFEAQAQAHVQAVHEKAETIASRKASQNSLTAMAGIMPELVGGSADLAGSNLTLWPDAKGITAADASGNYIYYGVREFGMSAIMNGIALHGGFVPFGATFLVFMEYARNALRMAALMRQQAIFVYTHDTIALGEDGPTHQPIEQLASMRSTPDLSTWRPCDAVESAVSWKYAAGNTAGPSALVFSRQALPHQDRDTAQLANIEKGGYILKDCQGTPDLILIAAGSEVALAMDAAKELQSESCNVRVVSMPCQDLFDRQDASYQESVLPSNVENRIAIEAGHPSSWYKYTGLRGKVIGMETFGASAPINDLLKHFGFTVERVVADAKALMA